MIDSDYLAIVANSGRMLAMAARQSGLVPLVIDLYADQDTCSLAEEVVKVDTLSSQCLRAAIEYIEDRYPVRRALYGSGLEYAPECVDTLARHFDLLGNNYLTFQEVQHKHRFFALLHRLEIPYPKVMFDMPQEGSNWLIKPLQGSGGLGISRFTGQPGTADAVYWQAAVEGVAGSVLFLADGWNARAIGYNTQWNSCVDSGNPFVFAGIINKSPLSNAQEQRVDRWVQGIVQAYALKGLNTLDFIVKDDEIFVLEVNPRPSASLQLYDGDILSQHIEACYGKLENKRVGPGNYCAYHLVFADRALQVPEHFQWPEGCADLPASGLIIRKGQPICSIIARDKNARQVYTKLMATQQTIVTQLKEGH